MDASEFVFDDMMQSVHIDEKWFYATRVKRSYYLAPGVEPPHRTCKSKRFITKLKCQLSEKAAIVRQEQCKQFLSV
ncbi:hypothetical protein H310_06642 [Aphanomyces invadans]|uniref:Transposase n=1 Tax=Aphanomyces invadans TaxID=157072 RepID=A0A024U3M3_9STRA|nr:hypothetical protein H310_06642 [Aphanomyces invadans]ETW01006.1 hypothetical protein H310_06642 [Aphanomyces invadans]|eukprot:XP_008870004.1 hypothetical protein H310_06642 [Aphanomyces invadans]